MLSIMPWTGWIWKFSNHFWKSDLNEKLRMKKSLRPGGCNCVSDEEFFSML